MFEYPFNIFYYFNIYCSFPVPKSADLTAICESQWISPSWLCWSLQIHLCPTIISTTSTTTASVTRDHIPSDIADLSNHLCIFILTKSDDTLFNASSILEEDVIEICIWFGYTHPGGVHWYSTTKSVMLFHTMDKLQIAAHGVMKASMLQEEAIRVKTFPPSAAHMHAYIAAVNGEPSGAQPPPSDEEEEPHSSLSNPHPGGRTPQHLQANLGDLADNELWQLMEDLHGEVALWELNMLPRNPTNTLAQSCRKWGSWYRWQGGHLSKRGEGGFPRPTILTSCPCTTRWREGAQKTTSSPPHLFNPMRT